MELHGGSYLVPSLVLQELKLNLVLQGGLKVIMLTFELIYYRWYPVTLRKFLHIIKYVNV